MEKMDKIIGKKIVYKHMMTGGDGHYVNSLVNGSRMLDFFGDVATELLVRADGDLSLFLGYDEVRFTAPVHVGDSWNIMDGLRKSEILPIR